MLWRRKLLIFGWLIFPALVLGKGRLPLAQAQSPTCSLSGLPANSFGLTSNADRVPVADKVRLMKDLGVSWVRVFVNNNNFYNASGQPDLSSLSQLDYLLAAYQQARIQPYLMVWNESEVIGYAGGCHNPSYDQTIWPEDLWHSPPKDWGKWEKYLTTLVEKYGRPGMNAVKYWEISFEENARDCPFSDDPQTYVDFLCRSASVIKSSDPEAKIILGRILDTDASRHDDYLEKILPLNAGGCFDIVSLGGPYGFANVVPPTQVKNYVTVTKEKLRAAGLNKPIWLTEGEYSSDANRDGLRDAEGDQQQKTNVQNFYSCGFAAGADKAFLNGLGNRRANFPKRRAIQIGLMDNNLQPKPAYLAYQEMATQQRTWLVGDLNLDGQVNETDLNLFLPAYGTTNSRMDFNQDGAVNATDYLLLMENYGHSQ